MLQILYTLNNSRHVLQLHAKQHILQHTKQHTIHVLQHTNTADISHLYTLSRHAGTQYRQTQQIRALHTEQLACYLYKLNNATKIRRINVQTISYINWTNDIADCVTYGISVKRYPQQDIKLQEIRYEEHKNR